MAAYYLMAQLPTLDGLGEAAAPPITEERFLELCGRFLGKRARRELESNVSWDNVLSAMYFSI